MSTYFHGITTLPKVSDEKKVLENYKREQQRHIKRQIRRYKRLAEGSITEKDREEYQNKVKEWQTRQREYLKGNPQLRRAYNKEKTRKVPFDYDQQYDKLKGIVTKDNITIDGVSHHLKLRAVERGISSKSIEEALKNSLDIGKIKQDSENRPSVEYTGKVARVQVNPDTGNIITVWRTSTEIKIKYKGDRNEKN